MVILDEGNNLPTWLYSVDVFNVIVDGGILVTFLGVIENFLGLCECQLK